MLHVTKIVSITLLLAVSWVASAQESTGAEPPFLQKYEKSPDLPNGIAFHMTLRMLDHLNTRFGPADPAALVAQELRLGNVDAHHFVSQALTTLYLIKTDVRAQLATHACQFAGPSVEKKDKYAALQQTYDIHKAIYDHYYDQTKASLDPDTGERLQQWMDQRKLSMAYMEIDFEKADQRSGRDPNVRLSRMCGEAN